MSKIIELRNKRNTLWEQTKAFLEEHRDANGLVEASAVEQYDKMAADVKALGDEIKRLEDQMEMDAKLSAATSAPVHADPKSSQRKGNIRPTATAEYNDAFWNMMRGNNSHEVRDALSVGVGTISVTDKTVYRKLSYESTFDVLKRQCLGAEGGYFFLRRENGVNYIDWLASMPYTCNQPVEFGLNLLNMTSDFDGSSIATCVIPLGDPDEETNEPLTVAEVNGGSDVIDSAAVSTYGRITKAVTFSGVKEATTLYADGLEYLQNTQFDNLIIECSAAELHLQNDNYEQFRVGQMIRCRSTPHLLDRTFPLVKLSLRLDTAAKQITLGTAIRQSLTRIYKDVQETEDEEDPATEAEIEHLENRIDHIGDQIGGIQNQIDHMVGIDNWIHQIDGTTVDGGTINFVTVT